MQNLVKTTAISGMLLLVLAGVVAEPAQASDERNTIVVTFKDGHQQSFAMAEIARIDLKAPAAIVFKDGHRQSLPSGEVSSVEFGAAAASASTVGRAHFLGKWKVGEGNGGSFFITLTTDGTAEKSIGSSHGTWSIVDGEARIAWDDGWHDAIRKVGKKHEKVAFEPGKSFSDVPSNVTEAWNTRPEPI
jgi:hypothetical protein